ncbi:GNAT family N-acetyltransferase [Rhizobiales bacterium]|uniref:GNAT family N-acetyltransferase n=1 Tax=Hongsoonwoonella zoysiae TaxID=2821844 RepID=UPI00156131C7|nr:GNAT family N-acetyltransferase [Hongsoonwoonella zoysiae]NRG18381.1 GNAT family N-acetyltransferase [Hongsoonwoonella zoysiae]
MPVRRYRPDDASRLSDIYKAAVLVIGARYYSPDQLRAWAALAPTPKRFAELMGDGRIALVATDKDDQAVAFADLEPDGHIHFLYAAPEAAGTGAVSTLYDRLEEKARDLGFIRLYAEASEAALRFFLKKGFTKTARREFEVEGVPIHNYAVEKRL